MVMIIITAAEAVIAVMSVRSVRLKAAPTSKFVRLPGLVHLNTTTHQCVASKHRCYVLGLDVALPILQPLIWNGAAKFNGG